MGWVGLGQSADGLGWIGSHKMDPWTTLGWIELGFRNGSLCHFEAELKRPGSTRDGKEGRRKG